MTFFLEILDFSSKKSITVLKIRIQVFLPKSARKFILSFYLFSYKRKAEKWWFVKPCGSICLEFTGNQILVAQLLHLSRILEIFYFGIRNRISVAWARLLRPGVTTCLRPLAGPDLGTACRL